MMAEECRRLLDSLDDDSLRQVAISRMEGYNNDEIAAQLGCARRTVARPAGPDPQDLDVGRRGGLMPRTTPERMPMTPWLDAGRPSIGPATVRGVLAAPGSDHGSRTYLDAAEPAEHDALVRRAAGPGGRAASRTAGRAPDIDEYVARVSRP